MNTKNLIPRILALPFMVFILLIPMIVLYFKWMRNFILYGGEIIAYEEKDERKSVRELYFMMKDNYNLIKKENEKI